MAIPTKTLDDVVKRALANFRTSFPGKPLGPKRFLGRTARALAVTTWGGQKAVEDLNGNIVLSKDSDDETLDGWAFTLGLSDGQGGICRKKPSTATGGAATLTGAMGTNYNDGIKAIAEDGITEIALSGTVTIAGSPPGSGSVAGAFVSVSTGADANLPAGTKCTWESAPFGADPTFILTGALEGAQDTETSPALFERILERLQTPPRGGVDEDYREWSDEGGAGYAYVYDRRSGTGSVDIVVVINGQGQNRAPTGPELTAVQASIDQNKPGAVESATAYAPNMPDANGHFVQIRVVPSKAKYDFDWDDTSGSFDVDLFTAGPPATIRLNTIAPTSLKSQIDIYKSSGNLVDAPRLQVCSTYAHPTGSVVNLPVRAVDYADGGGKTTLTLETLPDNWKTPTASDLVFAYGPIVETIANGIQEYVDALGPSRASGYGDVQTPWQDTMSLNQLVRIAEEAVDTDGTTLVQEVLSGGATIDGVAADVEASDNTTDPPELLYLRGIAVTQ